MTLFEIANLSSSINARLALNATPQDRWAVIRVETRKGKRIKSTSYMNQQFVIRLKKTEQTNYTPLKRPWYAKAIASNNINSNQTIHFCQP